MNFSLSVFLPQSIERPEILPNLLSLGGTDVIENTSGPISL